MAKKKDTVDIWKEYTIGIQIEKQFGGQLPRSESEIRAMLEHRMPTRKPADATPIDELAEQVTAQVDVQDEESDDYLPGWSTFKHNTEGHLQYEGRSIRGHLKDCALQVAGFYKDIKNFRSKVVNRLYVVDDLITLMDKDSKPITEADDTQVRYIQVMTRQGPRSAIKYIDYVNSPFFEFNIKLMNDGIISMKHIESILQYGSVHGMGAERSQGWGRYSVAGITEL